MISTLLRAEALTAGYGKMAILHDVTFIVTPGELVAVIGPNGAGKSTAFKVIVGFLKPSEGRVLFDGDDITGLRPDQVLRRGLAYVPQGRIVFPQMTVLENLEMGAYIERDARKIKDSLDQVYALFPVLAERQAQRAGSLSGGEQQMLAVGRALMSRPKLILFDEPSMGLAPVMVLRLFDLIRRVREEGYTILVVEQNVRQVLKLVDRAYLLEVGRIKVEGRAADLAEQDFVRQAYVGL